MADTMIGRFLQGYSVDDLCRQFDLPPRAVEQAIRDSVSGVDQLAEAAREILRLHGPVPSGPEQGEGASWAAMRSGVAALAAYDGLFGHADEPGPPGENPPKYHGDPHFRARVRYAFMLGLPPEFTLSDLHDAAEKHEQCRFGRQHEAWRAGYFGDSYAYGNARHVQEGRRAAHEDLCPIVPPGLPIGEAQRDWTGFETYFEAVHKAKAG